MKYYNDEEIIAKVNEIWVNDLPDDIDIYNRDNGLVVLKISKMYDYVDFNLEQVMELAGFFDTMNINESRFASGGGCDTCDFGSSYTIEFTIAPKTS